MSKNPSQQSCCLLTACWPSPQPANLTLIRSKNARQVACLARLVICSYWFKEEEAIVSVSDSGAAGFFAPTPHVERKHSCERSRLLSLLLQYTACNLIRALCREQSDSALLFQSKGFSFSSGAAKLAYMLSPITADGHAAGGGLMLARSLAHALTEGQFLKLVSGSP